MIQVNFGFYQTKLRVKKNQFWFRSVMGVTNTSKQNQVKLSLIDFVFLI